MENYCDKCGDLIESHKFLYHSRRRTLCMGCRNALFKRALQFLMRRRTAGEARLYFYERFTVETPVKAA